MYRTIYAAGLLLLGGCSAETPDRQANSATNAGAPIGGFRFNARSLAGTAPFEWWSQIDDIGISTNPVTNGGNGVLSLASAARTGLRSQYNIHVPGLPAANGLHVECTFAQPAPDRVQWSASIPGAAGGLASRRGSDPTWTFDIARPSGTVSDPTITITPVFTAPDPRIGLSYCDFTPI